MTKFKKCDDCECVLNPKKTYRHKSWRVMGQSNALVKKDGQMQQERPLVLYLCEDCNNYHVNNKKPEDEELYSLLEVFEKKSSRHYSKDGLSRE